MKLNDCKTLDDLNNLDTQTLVELASRPVTHLDLARARIEIAEAIERLGQATLEAFEERDRAGR